MHEDPEVLSEGDLVKEEMADLKRRVDETIEDLDRAHEGVHRRRTRVPARRPLGRGKGRRDTKNTRSTT